MARPVSKGPTELELEILKILWQRGPLPAREVRDALVGFRDLARTSVITILNIMVKKKYLSRKKVGASFVYRPRVTAAATTGGMLKDLVDRAFDGSAAAVMLKLLESSDLDEAEIQEIRGFLDRQAGGGEQ